MPEVPGQAPNTDPNRGLRGSARDFTPDEPDADKLYVWTFSRAGGTGARRTLGLPAP